MLFPCGWPKSYFAFPSSYGHDELVSCLPCEASSFLKWPTTLVTSKRAIQLWAATENPFKLGQKFLPPSELLRVGPQLTAQYNPVQQSAVTLTSKGWIILYTLKETSKKVNSFPEANGPINEAFIVQISVLSTVQLFANSIGNCMVSRGEELLIGTADGMLQSYNWQKMKHALSQQPVYEFQEDVLPNWCLGNVDILSSESTPPSSTPSPFFPSDSTAMPSNARLSKGAIVDVNFSKELERFAVTFEDGSTGVCLTEGVCFSDLRIHHWLYPPTSSEFKITCARIGAQANLVAMGCTDGTVLLHKLAESSIAPVRKLTLKDWGHSGETTGPVEDICWNGDCSAFAVGFRQKGLVVWTPSGCRLMCSLPQTPRKSNSSIPIDLDSSLAKLTTSTCHEGEIPTLEWGISVLAWGMDGFRLWVGQAARAREIWEVKFVRSLSGRHRIFQPRESAKEVCAEGQDLQEVHLLQGDDRILLISELPSASVAAAGEQEVCSRASSSQLTVRHVIAPQEYITENWPIRLASVSNDGAEIVLAGTHGLVIYNRRTEKWRLFGDVSQEKAVSALFLSWLEQLVVVCVESSKGKSELLFFPNFHLDLGSLVLRHELPTVPVALDCLERFVLVASEPLNFVLYSFEMQGELSRSKQPTASLTILRELSLFTPEHPLISIALTKTVGASSKVPDYCVLLHWGGTMTLLDLTKGVEQFLAPEIECFWLSDVARIQEPCTETPWTLPGCLSTDTTPSSQRKQTINLVEMPWWAYGARGMELWFPSSLAEPLSPRQSPSAGQTLINQLDPELEFDREVYPIGISLADAAIIGVSQRLVRPSPTSGNSSVALPCFTLVPDTQPVLPCLLRRLLQKGAVQEARLLAKKHQKLGLHFSKSLEWLLFTSLEFQAGESCDRFDNQDVEKQEAEIDPEPTMLALATALVKEFPQYPDVVVSVARKTDTQLWPLLFEAVGRPSEILDNLLSQGVPHSAACLLVVVDKMEGSVLARALSLQVLQVALTNGEYDLVAELMRYAVSQADLDLIFTKEQDKTPQKVKRRSGSFSSWWSWMWNTSHDEPATKDNRPVVLSGTIHDHVRCLLEFGRLKPLASLAKSLSTLGAGLPALLSYRNEKESKSDEVTKESVLSALSTIRTEMTGPHFQGDAAILLEACQHAQAHSWSFVLALFLHEMTIVGGFKKKHPLLWDQVYYELLRMQGFEQFIEVMKEVQQNKS